jgi:hypothetical protein
MFTITSLRQGADERRSSARSYVSNLLGNGLKNDFQEKRTASGVISSFFWGSNLNNRHSTRKSSINSTRNTLSGIDNMNKAQVHFVHNCYAFQFLYYINKRMLLLSL